MTQIDPTRVHEDAEFKQTHHAQISHSLTHIDGGKGTELYDTTLFQNQFINFPSIFVMCHAPIR